MSKVEALLRRQCYLLYSREEPLQAIRPPFHGLSLTLELDRPRKTLSPGHVGKICQCFLPQRVDSIFSTIRREELVASHTLDQGGESPAEQGWLAQASPRWAHFMSQPSDFMSVYPRKSWGHGSADKTSSYRPS